MSMNCLYLFNPENDLALAANVPHFTPPKAAVALSSAAACLPLWYGERGDYVLAEEENREWVKRVNDLWDTGVELATVAPGVIKSLAPWGWSLYTRELFRGAGVPYEKLPSDSFLESCRQSSHRRITIEVYRHLQKADLPYPLPAPPVELFSIEAVEELLSHGEQLFLKSPLSGSGRGIIDTTTAPARQVVRLAEGVIKRQGSIMAEKRLDKVADFAMLYDIRQQGVRFAGYSLFFNANYSSYGGNMLLTDNAIAQKLCQLGIEKEWLDRTREAVSDALLQCFAGKYVGPIGVDMMVYRCGERVLIAPCVEVNVRMTMGRVAHIVGERYLSPGVSGIMEIVHSQRVAELPKASVAHGRLEKGSVYMTPPGGNEFAMIFRTL